MSFEELYLRQEGCATWHGNDPTVNDNNVL